MPPLPARPQPLVLRDSFTRCVPFADGREVIVRRGAALGHDYGLPVGERTVSIGGSSVVLSRYRQLLSPPPLRPGEVPMSPQQAQNYTPESEVVRTAGMEVLIRRTP